MTWPSVASGFLHVALFCRSLSRLYYRNSFMAERIRKAKTIASVKSMIIDNKRNDTNSGKVEFETK